MRILLKGGQLFLFLLEALFNFIYFSMELLDFLFQLFQVLCSPDPFPFKQPHRSTRYAVLSSDDFAALGYERALIILRDMLIVAYEQINSVYNKGDQLGILWIVFDNIR